MTTTSVRIGCFRERSSRCIGNARISRNPMKSIASSVHWTLLLHEALFLTRRNGKLYNDFLLEREELLLALADQPK